MKRSIILLSIVLFLITSCSAKKEVRVDAITSHDTHILTSFDGIHLYQQGMRLTIASLDFDLNKSYSVSISSPEGAYSWNMNQHPITKDNVSSIILHDIMMPSHTHFPSGIYSIEILQDDVSFVTSTFEYERRGDEKPLEPIEVSLDETGFTISTLEKEDVTIELFDASHFLLLELKETFIDKKLNDEEFRNSINHLILYKGIDTIYRIIL